MRPGCRLKLAEEEEKGAEAEVVVVVCCGDGQY